MTSHNEDTIRAALACIPADLPRDDWVRIGMALKSELGEASFDLFDAWSKAGKKYHATATRDTWRSVKPGGGVTIGTLMHLAQEHGFRIEAVPTPAPAPTPEQLAAQAKARREAEAREQAERSARQHEAATEAARLWADASEAGSSAYLARKGVQPHGVRFAPGGVLLVPMRDAAGELWNMQRILSAKPADGGPDKLFLKGGRKTGLMHWCGDPSGAAVLLVAEGYATAASLHEATGYPVAVAFDAGNLAHVVKALRGRFKGARILVCGDDDRATEARTGRNPGREKAIEAAKLVRSVPVFPEGLHEGGSDFNDLAAHAGPEAVRVIVGNALQAANASEAASTPDRPKKTAPSSRQRTARVSAAGSVPPIALTLPPIPFEWASEISEGEDDLREIVEGVLTAAGMSVMYGESNSGKSYLACHLGICMSLGRSWLGKRVERGAVIYVAGEGAQSIRRRLVAYHKHHGHAPGLFGMIPTALNLMDPSADVENLIALVAAKASEIGEPVLLVIVDTVARAMGGSNENASEDMARLVSAGDRIREETDAHVLWIHHSGKDTTKGARGHSSLRASLDTEIEVTADEATATHTATITKQRDLATKGQRLAGKFVSVQLGTDQWGNPVTACAVEDAEPPATTARARVMAPAQQAVLGYLAGQAAGVRRAAIVAAIEPQGISRPSVYRAINTLVELGLAVNGAGLVYAPKE